MQEVRDALIAFSEGRSSAHTRLDTAVKPSALSLEAQTAATRPASRARRTSFAYTSRIDTIPDGSNSSSSSGGVFTSPFHAIAPLPQSAVAEHTPASPAREEAPSTCVHSPRPSVVAPSTAPAAADTARKTTLSDLADVVSYVPSVPLSSSCPQRHGKPGQQQQGQQGQQPARLLAPLTSSTTAAFPFLSSATVLRNMDESQRQAATQPIDVPLLIQAGAGSGKTQTMAARIVFLLENGVPARQILGICFTRQAAETLRERVRSTLPASLVGQARALKLKTFHSFGLECLRRFGVLTASAVVADARMQRNIARLVVETHAVKLKSSEAVTSLVDYVNHVKMKKKAPTPVLEPNMQDAFLFPHYEELLHDGHNAVDFGDLQLMFYHLIRPVPEDPKGDDTDELEWKVPLSQTRLVSSDACAILRRDFTHFVVDEFQDFNEIQMELLALLAGDACRVTCVGDPNQCIYSWRGAIPEIFTKWKQRFPATVEVQLALNYRSDAPIVEASNRVVQATQLPFYHREDRPVTLVQCYAEYDELDAVRLVIEHVLRRRDPQICLGDIAILCRTRRRVDLFHKMLSSLRIPVRKLQPQNMDRLASMLSLQGLLRLCLAPHTAESNADVRTVLTNSPAFRLPRVAARNFFLALDAVCHARRDAEAAQIIAWRNTIDAHDGVAVASSREEETNRTPGPPPCTDDSDANDNDTETSEVSSQVRRAPTTPGIRPDTYSYFGVLQELVFHNFSHHHFPKLEIAKKNQKIVRKMVQLVLQVRDMLARPACDVEDVLRQVLRDGGYDKESAAAVVLRGGSNAGYKRPRGGPSNPIDLDDAESGNDGISSATMAAASDAAPLHSRTLRVGARLAAQSVAEHNMRHHKEQYEMELQTGTSAAEDDATYRYGEWMDSPWPPSTEPSLTPRAGDYRRGHFVRRNGKSGTINDAEGEGGVLPPEEEAAVWAEERMNLSELILRTYHSVHEVVQREVASQAAAAGAAIAVDVDEVATSSAAPSRSSSAAPLPSDSSSRGDSTHLSNGVCGVGGARGGPDDSMSNVSAGGGAGPTSTLLQSLCPPALVLRRVLDEFISLLPSDNYGPMRTLPNNSAATGRQTRTSEAQWIGQITVGTVHRAKGMEWPVVLVPGCWVTEFPINAHSEERRIFYVALSRAMKHLFCFTAEKRSFPRHDPNVSFDRLFPSTLESLMPSPFLMDLGPKLECLEFTKMKEEIFHERNQL